MRHVAAVAAACVVLAGCGGGEASDTTTASNTAAASETAAEEPVTAGTIRPGISAEDCDDPDAALTQAEWMDFCAEAAQESAVPEVPTEGSVTEQPAFQFPGGPQAEIIEVRTEPDDLDDGIPNENDDYDTAAYVTVELTNTSAEPILMPNSEINVTTNLLFGVNRYDAQGWASGGGISDLPQQLVPGTSATMTLHYSLPAAEVGNLAFTFSPGNDLWSPYTFTDLETLLGLPAAPDVAPPTEECIGYGCSPEQDAELNQGEAEAND